MKNHPSNEEAAPLLAADGHEEDENILVAQVCVKQVHGLKNFSCGAKIGCTTGSRRHTKKHFVNCHFITSSISRDGEGAPVPRQPSDQECERHSLAHEPFWCWCKFCVTCSCQTNVNRGKCWEKQTMYPGRLLLWRMRWEGGGHEESKRAMLIMDDRGRFLDSICGSGYTQAQGLKGYWKGYCSLCWPASLHGASGSFWR